MSLEGEMRRRGIKPNAYTVTSCISALARGGEWERAAQVRCPYSTLICNSKRHQIVRACADGWMDAFVDMFQEHFY